MLPLERPFEIVRAGTEGLVAAPCQIAERNEFTFAEAVTFDEAGRDRLLPGMSRKMETDRDVLDASRASSTWPDRASL